MRIPRRCSSRGNILVKALRGCTPTGGAIEAHEPDREWHGLRQLLWRRRARTVL